LWSDETKVSIFGSDGVRYVKRRAGEECLPECTTATMKHPHSIMVCGCMGRNKVGRLQVLDGNVNADRYIKEVLKPKLLPSACEFTVKENPSSSSKTEHLATLRKNA